MGTSAPLKTASGVKEWGTTATITGFFVGALISSRAFIAHGESASARLLGRMPPSCPLWVMAIASVGFMLTRTGSQGLAPTRDRFYAIVRSLFLGTLWFFLFWICLAAATAHPVPALWGALVPYLAAAVWFLLLFGLQPKLTAIRTAVLICAVVLAGSVAAEALGLVPLSSLRAPGGVLGNRNFAGEYFALATPALVLVAPSRLRWFLLLITGVVLAWTRCRTAWIASAGAILALIFAAQSRTQYVQRATGALVLFGGIALSTLIPTKLRWSDPNPIRSTFTRLFDVSSGSGAYRIRQYFYTWRLVRNDWGFGVGPGHWQDGIRRFGGSLAVNRIAHSDYVRALADGGVPAAGALVAAYATAIVLGWKRRDQPETLATVVAASIIAVADAPSYRPESLMVLSSYLAVIARASPE